MSMEVRKESNGLKNSMVTREELAIINRFTKRALKEDEVYTFAVRLCDNEMDRDGERFPRTTLEELAELFVGKSGIFDHEWTARGQAARIYRTEIVEEAGVCSQGEGRCYLKGYVWPHNPETYTISFQRKVAVAKVPFGRYGMQDLGLSYRVMEGEGVFAGKGAYNEFKKLASVFYQGGPGLLIHPVWQASQAYFVLLELAQQPLENYVRYRFAFWETSPLDTSLIRVSGGSGNAGTGTKTASSYYTVKRGDTLWGIANTYGVTLTALLNVNPQIKNPNRIAVGERVTLP